MGLTELFHDLWIALVYELYCLKLKDEGAAYIYIHQQSKTVSL